MSMQQHMGELERTKQKISFSEFEKDRVLEAHEANNVTVLILEIENLKALLSSSRNELKVKDKKIKSLELKLEKTREFEVALARKDQSVVKLEDELKNLKEMENVMSVLLAENKKMIRVLEAEVDMEKQAKAKMVDSLVIQTKQLETTKIELEESKIEITYLSDKMELLEKLSSAKINQDSKEDVIRGLEFELHVVKENLARAQESETKASLKAKFFLDEMELLKNEVKLANEADEKSRKAMEDLAIALKEVAKEANQAKEKLVLTETELEHVKEETEHLKAMVRETEEQYEKLLEEAKQETKLQENTTDRLKLEAEETLLAWNGKEMCFVNCIKRAEEERTTAQHENSKLSESLRVAREETYKLRDILKQAISEANAAKAAGGIAREENSQLKDLLTEKEEALHFLTQENEHLRINETTARENVEEFKRMLSKFPTEFETECKLEDSMDEKHENNKRNMNKTSSFNLEDLKFMHERQDGQENFLNEDPEKAEALKGSIFDVNEEMLKSEIHTPKSVRSHQRRSSSISSFTDGGTPKSEDFDNLESSVHDDSRRRARTMFRRVGDLLAMRRSSHSHKKEPTIDQ